MFLYFDMFIHKGDVELDATKIKRKSLKLEIDTDVLVSVCL